MPAGRRSRKHTRFKRIMRLIEQMRHAPPAVIHHGNRVVLFPAGSVFFGALFAAIRAARHTILLEYYLIRDDHTGRQFADELRMAAERGVRVFMIYDYIGCIDTPSTYFRQLSQAGVELVPFNVPSFRRGIRWFDRRNHRKVAIIDNTLAFLGGINIGDEYSGRSTPRERFRDVGFSLAGSAVHELESIFAESWEMERGTPPPMADTIPDQASSRAFPRGNAEVSIVSGGPHHRSSYIRAAFRVSIAVASSEILIASPYFIPGPRLVRTLLRAARRGVRIRILLPAVCDVPLVQIVSRIYFSTLLRAGIEILELEHEILHAKVMLVDGIRTIIGSANMDQRSFHRNFEINCLITSQEFCTQIHNMLTRDFGNSRKIDLANHEQRGIVIRIMEKVVNLFGWFL